jgi:hypothetical protein
MIGMTLQELSRSVDVFRSLVVLPKDQTAFCGLCNLELRDHLRDKSSCDVHISIALNYT